MINAVVANLGERRVQEKISWDMAPPNFANCGDTCRTSQCTTLGGTISQETLQEAPSAQIRYSQSPY